MSSLVFLPVALCWWAKNSNNDNNNNHNNVYVTVIMAKDIVTVYPVHLMNGAEWPPSQSTWAESAENWQLPSTSTIAIVIITQPLR